MDLGTKSLGLALTDKTNTIASPYQTLKFSNYEDLKVPLNKIINEKNIECLILGLPKNMNNSLGFAVDRTNEFKKFLENNFKLPIILVDERLSTKEAEDLLISLGVRREKRKEVIDSYAAAIILDTYLKKKRG